MKNLIIYCATLIIVSLFQSCQKPPCTTSNKYTCVNGNLIAGVENKCIEDWGDDDIVYAPDNDHNHHYTKKRNWVNRANGLPDDSGCDPFINQNPSDSSQLPPTDYDTEPYIIPEPGIACTPQGNFRVESVCGGTDQYLTSENCSNTYYFDATQKESVNFMVHFKMTDFDPAKHYVLQVKEKGNTTTILFSTPILFKADEAYEKYGGKNVYNEMQPKRRPNSPRTVSGVIKISIPSIFLPGTRTEIVPVIAECKPDFRTLVPDGKNLEGCTITASSVYIYNNQQHTLRTINLFKYGTTFFSIDSLAYTTNNVSTFTQHMGNVFHDSDIRSYISAYASSIHNHTQWSSAPVWLKLLIDQNGNAILLKSQLGGKSRKEVYRAFLEWLERFYIIHKYVSQGLPDRVNNINKLMAEVALKQPGYNYNRIGLIHLNGLAIYDIIAGELKPVTDASFDPIQTIYDYKEGVEGGRLNGITGGDLTSETTFTPISVVYGPSVKASLIANELDVKTHFGGLAMVTAFHELAHARYYTGTNNINLTGYTAQHHAYITGIGSRYCLMRTKPELVGETMQTFYKNQIKQMYFSEGLQQRMRNVFTNTY